MLPAHLVSSAGVSKDSDFRQLAFLHGSPPKVIWVRMGNASTLDIFNVLRSHLDAIEVFSRSADEALLVIPSIMPLNS